MILPDARTSGVRERMWLEDGEEQKCLPIFVHRREGVDEPAFFILNVYGQAQLERVRAS